MSAFQITDRIKQDVRNARVVGEFTVKIGAQKFPGIIWGVVSKIRSAMYPTTETRVRPVDEPVAVVSEQVTIATAAEPHEGYDLLTGAQVVDLLASVTTAEAQSIFKYECAHRNRAVIIAAAQSVMTTQ
jgi:hypothetical protein